MTDPTTTTPATAPTAVPQIPLEWEAAAAKAAHEIARQWPDVSDKSWRGHCDWLSGVMIGEFGPLVAAAEAERDAARAEVAQLRGAIKRAGFAVMETSGDWLICDVSEAATRR